nr:cytochrome b-245 light chain [Parasteatoda tepidariorum]
MYRKDLFAAERMYQGYLEHFIMKLGTYGRSYYVRFYVYLCLSIPCFFLLPTIFGGACVMTGSLVYLKAALSGFEWQPFPRSSERSIAVRDVKPDYSQICMMKETVC